MSSSSRSFNVPLENGFLLIFAELVSEGTFPFSICTCQMFSSIYVYLCCGRPFYKITYPIFTLMMFVFGSCYGRMHRSDHSDKWFYLVPLQYGYFMVYCALTFHGVWDKISESVSLQICLLWSPAHHSWANCWMKTCGAGKQPLTSKHLEFLSGELHNLLEFSLIANL